MGYERRPDRSPNVEISLNCIELNEYGSLENNSRVLLPFQFSTVDGCLKANGFCGFILEYPNGMEKVIVNDLTIALGQHGSGIEG